MQIDLLKLNYLNEIIIDEEITIPSDIYSKMDIVNLLDVKAKGKIILDSDDNYFINLDLSGTMMLHDSVTYDIIPYKFNVKIEETLEKTLKTLDLISFLWHYIILEVPLRFTNSDISSIEKDNYRIISEEEYKRKNNPFDNYRIE